MILSRARQHLAAEPVSPSSLALLGWVMVPSWCAAAAAFLQYVPSCESRAVPCARCPGWFLPLLAWCHQPMGAAQQVVEDEARLQLPSPAVWGHCPGPAGPSTQGPTISGGGGLCLLTSAATGALLSSPPAWPAPALAGACCGGPAVEGSCEGSWQQVTALSLMWPT